MINLLHTSSHLADFSNRASANDLVREISFLQSEEEVLQYIRTTQSQHDLWCMLTCEDAREILDEGHELMWVEQVFEERGCWKPEDPEPAMTDDFEYEDLVKFYAGVLHD